MAIDQAHQGRGIGIALVRDAALRLLHTAEVLGIRVLVHAISNGAKAFYEAVGFQPSPSDPMMLIIGLQGLRRNCRATRTASFDDFPCAQTQVFEDRQYDGKAA
ncbi:GNAT family N-acetyltransferase [Rhizobium tibeticum]|uniref:GNAT family N-acetyltransferase n=1 Tax=Rhizobium tibeticum TaxID=501024 RepID=UPI0035214649